MGPLVLGLVAPLPSILLPEASSLPKTDYKNSPLAFSRRERSRNTETPKQRTGDLDWRGETPAGRCRGGLHLPQRHLHRLHDEEGVVPHRGWAHAGSYVVYLSLPWCDLYVIMSFVI